MDRKTGSWVEPTFPFDHVVLGMAKESVLRPHDGGDVDGTVLMEGKQEIEDVYVFAGNGCLVANEPYTPAPDILEIPALENVQSGRSSHSLKCSPATRLVFFNLKEVPKAV
jgi:hypothetical protein